MSALMEEPTANCMCGDPDCTVWLEHGYAEPEQPRYADCSSYSDHSDGEFLRDLAGRLYRTATPAMGFDQGDTDRLYRIARAQSEPRPVAWEDVKWRERWHGSEPQRGSSIVDEHGNLIVYLGGDEATHDLTTKIVGAHNAALATHSPAPMAGNGVLEALDEALKQYAEPMSMLNSHELGERLAGDVAEIVRHARLRVAHPSTQEG